MAKIVNSIEAYRTHLELTQEQLGERVGVTRQTIAAWEKGERSPSLPQLVRLAKVLGVPVDLLIAADKEGTEEPTLLFRADKPEVLSKELRLLLSRYAEDYAAVERLVGELSVLPESRPLEGYDAFTIERIAGEIRDWLGVEDAPLGDVLSLLENKGLKIIRHRLPNEVSGFSAYTAAWGGMIFVNSEHPPERQYFTALHELAHLIFHRQEYNAPSPRARRGDPREKAAHHFAAAVLLPKEVVEQELRSYRGLWLPEPLLMDLKQRYGVSIRTLLMRAGDVGIISKQQVGQQIGMLNKTYGKEGEPGKVEAPKLLERLERLVFNALYKEKLTTSRAAEILRWPLMDVRLKLAEWLEGVPT